MESSLKKYLQPVGCRRLGLLILGIGCAWTWFGRTLPAGSTQADSVNGITWRLTRHGWQDISSTFTTAGPPAPGIESIHPALWALWILVAVLVTLLWSSSEWEYSRLAQSKSDRDRS